jgi:nucleoid-associated protein YgaU
MSAGLEKARLVFLESSKKGPGGRTSVNGSGELVFGFNPKDYTIAKSAEWKRTPTKGATQVAMPEFVGAQGRTLTVEMFMDASEDKGKDVGKDVETLMACLVPRPSSIAKDKPFTMFHPDGRPTRAVCQVTLEEVPNGPGNQNPTSGSLEAMRSHTVVAGDTLASLAYAEYGDPTRWRVIADANRIEDPLRMRPGTRLLVPAADSSPGAQP